MNQILVNQKTVTQSAFFIDSEIAKLLKLLVHFPNDGIGLILPSKSNELLYDDIVHLEKMRDEYQVYMVLLRYFLDGKIAGDESYNAMMEGNSNHFNPSCQEYFKSDNILDVQKLLADILINSLCRFLREWSQKSHKELTIQFSYLLKLG